LIVYLDTSSLVKLYVDEAHSDRVREWTAEAEVIATSRVAHPETLSALTRRHNRGDIAKREYEKVVQAFIGEWGSYVALDFDEVEAGRLVRKYGLRGFDAVHLASAKLLASADADVHLVFSSFDERLNNAARSEGFVVLAVAE
jgi:predicted nucleic acid-binding protein